MSARAGIVLVLNAGSSSIKFSVFRLGVAPLGRELRGQVSGIGQAPRLSAERAEGDPVAREFGDAGTSHAEALDGLLDFLRSELAGEELTAVGHRVVHGGLEFVAPVRVDGELLERLQRYVPLAPLHQPHNLAAISRLMQRRPGVPQFACFDTSFHSSIPRTARLFALPPRFAEAGVLRYGFHGLSYEYVADVLPGIDARAAAGRTVVFHLGNGASMCALEGCRSVATSMGFTAVEGLPMGTRSGSLDPGVLLFCLDELGMSARGIERLLYRESGLLGLSGISSDMRDLLASGADRARVAVDVFVYRACRELGSLAAALGGLDAVVFTAGIGEHRPEIRRRICEGSAWLGLELDDGANRHHGPRISTTRSPVTAWVVPTDEESMIARHVVALLDGAAA